MRSDPINSQSLQDVIADPGRPVVYSSRTRIQRHLLQQTVLLLLICAGALLFLIPWFWMILTAGKSADEIWHVPPIWIPENYQWQNFIDAWNSYDFAIFFGNTTYISLLNVVAVVFSCSLAAFAFSRIQFPGRDILFVLVLSTMMLPTQVTLIPLFIIFSKLGWVNTHNPLIVPLFFGDAFSIFLLRQFLMTLPREYDEAALLDGCSRIGLFFRILLPQIVPALIVVGIYQFTWSWNDFFGPLIYLNSPDLFTITLGLQRFVGKNQTNIQYVMAMTGVSALVPITVFFLTQRTFLQGIVVTGVKG